MESKIFVDTDVIIDFLIDRHPYAIPASVIFDLAEKKELEATTSSLCLSNVHYITRKIVGEAKAREIIQDLIEIIDVMPVDKKDIIHAINSNFKDFEDAIQHSVATSDKSIRAIVTRNTKDYKKSIIPVFNSDTYVQMIKNEK